MTTAALLALLGLGIAAGALGAMIGIGGGVLIVPALVLLFHASPHAAVATSLVAVVATSTAAGSAYVGSGLTNMRLGMTLEIATTVGGVSGGLLASVVSPAILSMLFAALLVLTSALLALGREHGGHAPSEDDVPESGPEASGFEEHGRLAGAYFDEHERRLVHYQASRWPLGAAVSLVAGIVSGLLGVGGGFLKVPAMSLGMRVPIRVAAATSNFMIGVTALSSLAVYLARGFVRPELATPVALGVVLGSLAATRVAGRLPRSTLRRITAIVLLGVAVELAVKSVEAHVRG